MLTVSTSYHFFALTIFCAAMFINRLFFMFLFSGIRCARVRYEILYLYKIIFIIYMLYLYYIVFYALFFIISYYIYLCDIFYYHFDFFALHFFSVLFSTFHVVLSFRLKSSMWCVSGSCIITMTKRRPSCCPTLCAGISWPTRISSNASASQVYFLLIEYW